MPGLQGDKTLATSKGAAADQAPVKICDPDLEYLGSGGSDQRLVGYVSGHIVGKRTFNEANTT